VAWYNRTTCSSPYFVLAADGVLPKLPAALVKEFKISANPLVWVVCRRFKLISKLSIVPFEVVPRRTACGCGWSGGGREVAGTGMMPNAWSAGSEATGS